MKKILNISLLLTILLISATIVSAQKYGYLNSGAILASMPEVTTSDVALKVYQDSLIAIGEEKAAALKADFEGFMKEYQDGTIGRSG